MASALLNMVSTVSNSQFLTPLLRKPGFASSELQQNSNSEARTAARAALKANPGFGKRPEHQAKPKTLKELGKVEKSETYTVFVRKVKFAEQEEALTKWEKLGTIKIEAGTSVEFALIERKSSLAAGVKHQYPALLILERDEAVQYGFCEAKAGETEPDIIAIDLRAKQPEETVAAILRVEDGRTPAAPPPRSRRF